MIGVVNLTVKWQFSDDGRKGNIGKAKLAIKGTWTNGYFSTSEIIRVNLTGDIKGICTIKADLKGVPCQSAGLKPITINGVACYIYYKISRSSGLQIELNATRIQPPA